MSKIESLPSEFPHVVSSSDTQLVVSNLDIVQDCVPVETMDPFLLEDNSFKAAKGLVDYV